MSKNLNRREMLGSLGALAVAGGWIGLSPDESLADSPAADSAAAKEYTLPPLGYALDALEPHIDAKTMELHHDKHHLAYVNGLNAALQKLAAAHGTTGPDSYAAVRELTDAVSFHGSGHILHTIFWKNMKKAGGGGPKPGTTLARMIDRDFANFPAFQAHFAAASNTVQGSGWGILAWEPLSGRLLVFGAEKHQNRTIWGAVPLLVLDVWEHAYYLKYQNARPNYVSAFMNTIDWDNVAQRLDAAMKLTA